MPNLIDIPFDKRHLCWFCEEPSHLDFDYYRQSHCPHPSLSVPSCKECASLAKQNTLTSIWECRVAVKDGLMRIYQKDLAIGINWTEEELAESEFECMVFAGFKKSAWFMYQVARDRVNAQGWPLGLDGVLLDQESDGPSQTLFKFDGVSYPSLLHAIKHYSQVMALDKAFLQEIVSLLGRDKFSQSVKIARLNIGITQGKQRQIINDLMSELDQH
ncbi:hypothetical protein [Shewanella sp. SR44-3]|uniref:hypothetical protein n=1 Tax=Shewanella sp. SR44-3 TaxID=2760936 RepID=UPI0015FC600B|nr:hypothetical protein [Shewanella sp. SR44-3]MBB1268009.1 hypothetical protein [Shewanella sp. SR44-3]